MGFTKLLRLGAVSATLIAQGTLTAQTPGLSQSVAWNNAAVTFLAQTLDVTDTASAAGSLLARWRVGGVDKFVVSKAGAITAAGGVTAGAASFTTLAASSTAAITDNLTVGASTFVVTAATGAVAIAGTLSTNGAGAAGVTAGDIVIPLGNSVRGYTAAFGYHLISITAGPKVTIDIAGLGVAMGGPLAITGALTGVQRIDIAGTSASVAASTISLGGITRTTIGANGGATALTALPLGYIDIYVAGVAAQIPYYNRGA